MHYGCSCVPHCSQNLWHHWTKRRLVIGLQERNTQYSCSSLAHNSFSFLCQRLTAVTIWKFPFYHWKTSHTAISANIFSFYLSNGQKELSFLLFLCSCILYISNVLSHLPSGLNMPIFLSFFLCKSCCLNLWLFMTFPSLSKSFMKCLFNMGTVLYRWLLDAA